MSKCFALLYTCTNMAIKKTQDPWFICFWGAGKSIFLVSDSESFMYHFLLASVHHSWANLVNSGIFPFNLYFVSLHYLSWNYYLHWIIFISTQISCCFFHLEKYMDPMNSSSYYFISLPLSMSKLHERSVYAWLCFLTISPQPTSRQLWSRHYTETTLEDVTKKLHLAKHHVQLSVSFYLTFQQLTQLLFPSLFKYVLQSVSKKTLLFSSHVMNHCILVSFAVVSCFKHLNTRMFQHLKSSPFLPTFLWWITHKSFHQIPWC